MPVAGRSSLVNARRAMGPERRNARCIRRIPAVLTPKSAGPNPESRNRKALKQLVVLIEGTDLFYA